MPTDCTPLTWAIGILPRVDSRATLGGPSGQIRERALISKSPAVAIAVLIVFCIVASARAADFCPGIYASDPEGLKAARITGRRPVFFMTAMPADCDAEVGNCRNPWHLSARPGEIVAISRSENGYVCAEASNANRRMRRFGWLPANRVKPMAPSTGRRATWWVGRWQTKGAWISIAKAGDELAAKGGAVWRPSNPHFGDFSGRAAPTADGVTFAEGDDDNTCKVKLIPYGNQIVVEDNLRCGGMNVSFSGFYERK